MMTGQERIKRISLERSGLKITHTHTHTVKSRMPVAIPQLKPGDGAFNRTTQKMRYGALQLQEGSTADWYQLP